MHWPKDSGHRAEQTRASDTLIQNCLVMGFMSFRNTIKLLSILDLNDVPLSCPQGTIKEPLFSPGGVSAGSGCSVGRVTVLSHRWQGFHHRAAGSCNFWPDSIAAAQPWQQPHHGGQGNGYPDTHQSKTGITALLTTFLRGALNTHYCRSQTTPTTSICM